MEENNLGIRSINQRLKIIEQSINEGYQKNKVNFEDSILNNIEKKKIDFKKQELSKIKDHYRQGMENHEINSSENLIKVIQYSILYVESNIKKISLLLDENISSEFKLNICVELCKSVLNCDIDFLISSINSLCELLFNSHKKNNNYDNLMVVKYEDPRSKNKKKGLFKRLFNRK